MSEQRNFVSYFCLSVYVHSVSGIFLLYISSLSMSYFAFVSLLLLKYSWASADELALKSPQSPCMCVCMGRRFIHVFLLWIINYLTISVTDSLLFVGNTQRIHWFGWRSRNSCIRQALHIEIEYAKSLDRVLVLFIFHKQHWMFTNDNESTANRCYRYRSSFLWRIA